MLEVTDFDREWFKNTTNQEGTDQEIFRFLEEINRYESSLEISPELYSGE